MQVKGVRQLGTVLGCGRTRAAELAKQPWFPKKSDDGFWNVEEVQAAIAAADGRAPTGPTAEGDDHEVLEVLSDGDDPVEVARAACRLASKRLAAADQAGTSKALQGVLEAIAELGKTEGRFLELARSRSELIDRDVAKTLVGETVTRAIRALERYEVLLAGRVEAWLADGTFRALSPEDRARAVRAWAREQTYSVRALTADELEKMIAAETAERSA